MAIALAAGMVLVTGIILVIAFHLACQLRAAVHSRCSNPNSEEDPLTTWAETYAERIHATLPAADILGDITPEKLRIPRGALFRFNDKSLLTREAICFVALSLVAKPHTKLPPVLMAYTRLVTRRRNARGTLADSDAFAEASLNDMKNLFDDPFTWGQNWLAEFRTDPNDDYMVFLFAEHCRKLFQAYGQSIEETYRKTL
jgi:hypothetical protein